MQTVGAFQRSGSPCCGRRGPFRTVTSLEGAHRLGRVQLAQASPSVSLTAGDPELTGMMNAVFMLSITGSLQLAARLCFLYPAMDLATSAKL